MSDHEEHSLAKAINALRDWLASQCGCATVKDLQASEDRLADLIRKNCEVKPRKPHLLIFASEHDEPMERSTMLITLSKQIKPGYRRLVQLVPDEPVDAQSDGTFGTSEVVEGDSSAPTMTKSDDEKYPSTKDKVYAWVNADGALGAKTGRVTLDAHVGDGEVPLATEIAYVVGHPDATEVKAGEVAGVADELIPV